MIIGLTEELAGPFVSFNADHAVAEDEQEEVSHVCMSPGRWPRRGLLGDRRGRQRSRDLSSVLNGGASREDRISDGRVVECVNWS